MSLPSTHNALVVIEKGKVAVKQQPLPKFNEDEILIRVRAVALNPTDWKVCFRGVRDYSYITQFLTAC